MKLSRVETSLGQLQAENTATALAQDASGPNCAELCHGAGRCNLCPWLVPSGLLAPLTALGLLKGMKSIGLR